MGEQLAARLALKPPRLAMRVKLRQHGVSEHEDLA